MQKKTINISVPQAMADFIEREIEGGEYASTSDFFRVLVVLHVSHRQLVNPASIRRDQLIHSLWIPRLEAVQKS